MFSFLVAAIVLQFFIVADMPFLEVELEPAPLPSLNPAAATATSPQLFGRRPCRVFVPVRRIGAEAAQIS
eukprot:5251765-Heterocapsa_arctica.AAC.1